jgi:glycosyltransferase involved in cell wall biosynthesis
MGFIAIVGYIRANQSILIRLGSYWVYLQQKKYSVLHISPHYGGGVGSVVRSLIEGMGGSEYGHSMASLEAINDTILHWATHNRITFLQNALTDLDTFNNWVEQADVIHLHWWNHPLLIHWMAYGVPPHFRSILWSHVNGMHAPQAFFKELFSYPDYMVFATPYSLQTACLPENTDNIHVIQSRSEVDIVEVKSRKKEVDFKIGYIGTVDYVKMHPAFISLCMNAKIKQAKFIVCGGPNEAKLNKEVEHLGVSDQFEILGVVDNVKEQLADLDIFGYPLNPEHYGTGEQVLLEAMGAGVVPVVLDTNCEKYIIDNQENGIIASTLDEYSMALKYLYQNPDIRYKMSLNAVQKIKKMLKKQDFSKGWCELYKEVLNKPKRQHKLFMAQEVRTFSMGTGLLLQAYNATTISNKFHELLNEKKIFSINDFPLGVFSATRGSPYHYLRFFSDDKTLQTLCHRLELSNSTIK